MSFARFLKAKTLLLAAALLVTPLASCSFGPSRVAQPGINASRAGNQAIETYDKNSDGMVSGDELEHAPAHSRPLRRALTPMVIKASVQTKSRLASSNGRKCGPV